jgi:hypothetical protein
MALTLTSAIKDKIAYNLYSQAYSSLATFQAALVDGLGANALTRVEQFAQHWAQAGATAAPDVWEHWLVALATKLVAQNAHPDRFRMYHQIETEAMASALDSFSLDAATLATLAGQTIHVQGVRFYVMDACVRRKPRLFPSPAVIDAETQWVINYAWNKSAWNIRRRQVRLTIHRVELSGATWTEATKTLTLTGAFEGYTHTDGARVRVTGGTGATVGDYIVASRTSDDAIVLTTSLGADANGEDDIEAELTWVTMAGLGASEAFDSIASREWTFDDDESGGRRLSWADADEMAVRKARNLEGRPEAFRTEHRTSYHVWHFAPEPDGDYTLRGEVFIQGPGTPANATETAVFDRFAPEMRPHLRDLVLARVLQRLNAPDGRERWADAEGKIDALFPAYGDRGTPDDLPEPLDVYHDHEHLPGAAVGFLGGGM